MKDEGLEMFVNTAVSNVLKSMVPITRFNKGEAGKIFDEVRVSGFKIVVKNSEPIGVIVSPSEYAAMVDELEESRLYALVAERIENEDEETYSFEEILARDGLTIADIEAMEDVEIVMKRWDVRYTKSASKDHDDIDTSARHEADKAVFKVSQNPLPRQEGGCGEPLGNKHGHDLTGMLKMKLRKLEIRVVYRFVRDGDIVRIIAVAARADDEVYRMASERQNEDE